MPDHSINGKVVLIAGGVKNLGGLIARDLARHGAKAVVVHYNSASSQADANATVAAIEALGAKAVALQADLTTAAAVEKLFNDAVVAVGRPDIAINTVGKVLKKPMAEITEAEYDEMMAVNAKAAFFFVKEAGKQLNDNGKICTIVTSLLGAFTPFYAAYAGSKAPVEQVHPGRSQRIGGPRHFGNGRRARPDGYAVFLSGRGRGCGQLPQDGCGIVTVLAHRPDGYRGRGALHPQPCQRWLVGDRSNDSDQWRLHHQVIEQKAVVPAQRRLPCYL